MRQNANTRRSRGRGGRKSGNTRNQVYDSNGPGARVRGSASQIYEKYQQLARDASSSGDRVAAENLMQHAEHYFRLMMLHSPRPESGRDNGHDSDSDDGDGFQDEDGQDSRPEASFDEDRRQDDRRQEASSGASPNGGGSNGGSARGEDGENGSAAPRRRRRRSGTGNGSSDGHDAASADPGDSEPVTA